VILTLFFGCAKKQEEINVRVPFPVNAIIAKNEEIQGHIVSAVLLQGSKKVNIYSQTMGEVVYFNTALGKNVRAGETLLMFENSVQQANFRQATGAVEEAKLSFSANEKLFEERKISRAEFVRSQNNMFAAQTELANAQKAFNDTKITAPFDAIITMQSASIQKGNNISAGVHLFTLVDINKVKANISLGEKEIGLVKNGSQAKLIVAAAGIEVSGEITAVSAGSDSQTGTFSIEAEFNNPNLAIKDGMSGIVSLYVGETKFGISAPSNALINNRAILLAKNGLVVNTPVSVESISAGRVMILSGVSEKDTIIVSGITQLAGGDTVSVNVIEN
jgi:membrane fusion protein (multidrug efflux system)